MVQPHYPTSYPTKPLHAPLELQSLLLRSHLTLDTYTIFPLVTHVMMVSTQDGSMQELSTNRLVSPATPNVYSVWPAIGSNVPYVFVPNKTLLSGEGLGSGQRLVKWSFSEVPPTYDNHRAMKLKHDENSMFAQQDGKLFIMAGSESNTAEYFENDEWTIVKPYKSILYDACLTFIPRHPDRVYIIGGHNGTAINNDIEYYEFSSNTYYALTSIPGIPNIRALGCTGYITVSQLRSLVMIGGIVSDSVRKFLLARLREYRFYLATSKISLKCES